MAGTDGKGAARGFAPRLRGGDVLITVAGFGLALVCALFPWYIFYNKEQFGVREMQFSRGVTPGYQRTVGLDRPPPMEPPSLAGETSLRALDLFATGTAPDRAPETLPAEVASQPFPASGPLFELVHVANGRAMIRDDTGLWIVQAGSRLPDATEVKAIEKRDGQWVLVNTNDRVYAIE